MANQVNQQHVNIGQNQNSVVPPPVVNAMNFEPDVELKNWWLNTRKHKVRYNNVELHGFFSTYRFGFDSINFLLIIPLELWGLYNLYLLIDNFIYSSLLFFFDIILAIASHYWTKDLILSKNRLALAKFEILYMQNKTPRQEQEIEEKNISKYRMYSWIFRTLIILLALFKIISFSENSTSDTPIALTVTIMVTYLLVAYLHILSTGYCLSEILRRIRYNNQRNINLNSQEPTNYTIQAFREYDLDLQIKQNQKLLVQLGNKAGFQVPNLQQINFVNVLMTRGQHRLIDNKLQTWGVLEDSDLQNLVSVQPTRIQKEYLAIFGLMHQLEILNEPVRPPAPVPLVNADGN